MASNMADDVGVDGGSTISQNINSSSTISENEYQKTLENMYQKRAADFNRTTQPVINELMDQTRSTDITDRAEVEAGQLYKDSQTRQKHMMDYSMNNLLPSQRRALERSNRMASTKAGTAIETKAEADQVAQRQASRNQLMGMAEQLQSSGTASLSSAVQAKQQRDAAYKNAKTGFMSQVGSIVGGAVGMIGGPAGVAAGAAIGGAVGGMAA